MIPITEPFKLEKQFVEDWLCALRSGEYKQTKSSLCNSSGYCCLGVAGNLLGFSNERMQDHGDLPEANDDVIDEETGNFKSVEQIEIPESIIIGFVPKDNTLSWGRLLSNLNDDGLTVILYNQCISANPNIVFPIAPFENDIPVMYDFNAIADFIEANVVKI